MNESMKKIKLLQSLNRGIGNGKYYSWNVKKAKLRRVHKLNAFHVEFFNIHTKHYLITFRIFMSQVYPKCNKNMFIVFYVEYVQPYLVR